MKLIPLKSPLIKPNDSLFAALRQVLTRRKERLQEGDILVIASKAVAYSQGKLVGIKDEKDFRTLIRKTADKLLEEGDMVLTLKNHVLIPNAGIDRSNTPKDYAVLWPEKPFETAQELRKKLASEFKLKKLGILMIDSHCQPLRLGTSGLAIGWAGFKGVEDVRGKKDLFGKKMRYTQIAVADNLASAANLLMGETDASVPFVIVRGFKAKWTAKKASEKDYFIEPKDCIYRGLYRLSNF